MGKTGGHMVKGQGKAYAFLVSLLGHQGDACVQWPFARDKHGRGMLGYNGRHGWAHRLMCEMEHGKPPTPKHTAAHECGNGHEGCVNPKHLKWKTQAENLADCRRHGTHVRTRRGNKRRLTEEQISAIRAARGSKTQGQLATEFEVSEGTISDIWHGRTHRNSIKINHWTAEDIATLQEATKNGKTFPEIAKMLGRKTSAVSSYASKAGIKSGRHIIKITDRPEFSWPS